MDALVFVDLGSLFWVAADEDDVGGGHGFEEVGVSAGAETTRGGEDANGRHGDGDDLSCMCLMSNWILCEVVEMVYDKWCYGV